jgi:rhamnose transport system permease protein
VEPVGRDFNFTEKALIALAMALVIISGEIDLSVASIIAYPRPMMGTGRAIWRRYAELVVVGLAPACSAAPSTAGWSPGSSLPSIVVTIGTMSLFRGLSFIILGDQAYTGYPASFAYFGQGYVWWVFSFELVLFVVMAMVSISCCTARISAGGLFAIGNNQTRRMFSGVRVAASSSSCSA